MRKVLIIAVIAIGVGVIGFYALNSYIYNEEQGDAGSLRDQKNIEYVIDGEPVLLVNGRSERETAPGSASQTVTQFFGNEAEGDVNNDGVSDIAFLLTQETGGSGIFYYVVAALRTDDGYKGTNAVFLGDRIAPQNTEIVNGEIIVNFTERKEEEPMSASPSVGVSKYIQFAQGQLLEESE